MKLIALMGKSASGKDSLLKEFKDELDFHPKLSCTTRPMREGEVPGEDYAFLLQEVFEDFEQRGEFVESCWFRGWGYGTLKSMLNPYGINIGIFTPNGIRQLMKRDDIELKIYYITADDKIRLQRSLDREENPDCKEIARRFLTDEEDFSDISDIKYIKLSNNTPQDFVLAYKHILYDGQEWLNN